MASAYPTSFRECTNGPVEIMGAAAVAAAWNGHQRILGSRWCLHGEVQRKLACHAPPSVPDAHDQIMWCYEKAGAVYHSPPLLSYYEKKEQRFWRRSVGRMHHHLNGAVRVLYMLLGGKENRD